MRRTTYSLSLSLLVACASASQTEAPVAPAPPGTLVTQPPNGAPDGEDPYLWLEEVESERAMAWVKERNAKTVATLQSDPRYQRFHDEALRILEARDRIAAPQFRGRMIYNFWQDPSHVRGILRRTTFESYLTPNPRWTVVLDVDSLAAREKINWVYRGANCLPPAERICMITLSNGGKDANEIREFDMERRAFVPNGFRLPESKGGTSWIDENTILVSRDFGPGSLTRSGYPLSTRRLRRGQPLAQANEIFRGDSADVSAGAFVLRDVEGRIQAMFGSRGLTFYESDYWLIRETGERVKLDLPRRVSFQTLVNDQLVFTTQSDWKGFRTGDLLAFDLSELKASPANAKAYLILRPGPREAIEGVSNTRDKLVVALYENVKGAVYVYDWAGNAWKRRKLGLPPNSTVGIGSTSDLDNKAFFSVSNFLQPSSLWYGDVSTNNVTKVKSIPDRFDATKLTVDQYEATSADGTKIPYFVVRPKTMRLDGSNPTLLYGYGGYQVSLLPSYSATVGKLWLQDGGVYVVANTRGGGEFGPTWHQAALQANRHKAHEDFIAVAKDLIARRITSPRRLGIMGGSQGGLFMGVAMTSNPELFNAAVIQVPLFDMLRFHRMPPGASWIAEYGDPEKPEQRAWIARYSPYQAIRPGVKYPEAFIHTSTKDDRVHPGHARKAVARLEEFGYPVLFYENTEGGHSAASNLKESARRIAMEYTYLTRKLKD